MSLEITRPRYLAYVSDNFHLILLRIFSIVLIAKKKEKIHRCNDFWFLDRRKQSQKNNFVTFHPSKWMNVNAISHVLLDLTSFRTKFRISNKMRYTCLGYLVALELRCVRVARNSRCQLWRYTDVNNTISLHEKIFRIIFNCIDRWESIERRIDRAMGKVKFYHTDRFINSIPRV